MQKRAFLNITVELRYFNKQQIITFKEYKSVILV